MLILLIDLDTEKWYVPLAIVISKVGSKVALVYECKIWECAVEARVMMFQFSDKEFRPRKHFAFPIVHSLFR